MVAQTQVPYLSGKVVLLDRAKDHFQFTSDAVEVWVHGDLPRGLRRETVAKLGVGPWSSDIIRPRGSRWKCQLGVRKGLGHFSEKPSHLGSEGSWAHRGGWTSGPWRVCCQRRAGAGLHPLEMASA